MPSGRSLSKILTTSAKVAHALDWKKVSGASVLSLSIGRDTIDLAVAAHPSCGDDLTLLPSIPIETRVVNNELVVTDAVTNKLSEILQDWDVCGLVVNLPVQKEGWLGAPCGRVLHTLDHLLQAANIGNRSVCLWNESHRHFDQDRWGRSPIYTEVSDKSVHYASKEQYEGPSTVAADVWNDFCRAHWPELYLNGTWRSGAAAVDGGDDWRIDETADDGSTTAAYF